jgi:IS6 family transposase
VRSKDRPEQNECAGLNRKSALGTSETWGRRCFPAEIILLCVRWYGKYGISYRDLAEMMRERGVEVDPSTIMRWVHRYVPEIEKRVRRYQGHRSGS